MAKIRVLRVLEHEFDTLEQYHKVRTKWVQGHVDYGHERIDATVISEKIVGEKN